MDKALPPANRERGGPDAERRWPALLTAFLEERAARTGSRRTVEAYGRTARRFLRCVPDPSCATPLDVHRFAYAATQSGSLPAPSTVNARLAAVSGLYEFAVRMGVMHQNPAEPVRRPVVPLGRPRGLSRAEIGRLLAVIPDTPAGLVDRALIVTALLTGLRRSELVDLRVTRPIDIDWPCYEVRTKGGTVRRRELPAPAWRAIVAAADAAGRGAGTDGARPFALSDSTFYAHLRCHSRAAGLDDVTCHALRHSAAKLRREAGASVEEVSALLGHRSIATTATYLRRLEDEEDRGWEAVARGLGLDEEGDAPAPPPRCTAGSPLRPRPAQEARESGWWNSRSLARRGAQSSAPHPRPDPTAGGRAARRPARRRTAGPPPHRPGRLGGHWPVPALRRPDRALDGRRPLARRQTRRRR